MSESPLEPALSTLAGQISEDALDRAGNNLYLALILAAEVAVVYATGAPWGDLRHRPTVAVRAISRNLEEA